MIVELPVPTRVVFGNGQLARLGALTREYGVRALIVCGRTAVRRHGILDAAIGSLETANIKVDIFDGVSPEPRASEVDSAVAAAHMSRAQVIIGLGGGSAIDAAKATALGVAVGPIGRLVGSTLSEPIAWVLPVIAVPTVCGSGAEITKGAIITDDARNIKSGIRSKQLFPELAIIDPNLMASVPVSVAVASGFDAFSHAFEGRLAQQSDPTTGALAVQALGILSRTLPRLARGERGPGEHYDLALAALLGGANVATAGTCLPHRMQQAMGSVARVHISHGRGLAAVYRAWLEVALPHACEHHADMAEAMNAADVQDAVAELLRSIGADHSLSDHGFNFSDIDTFLGGVTGNLENDPIPQIDNSLIRRLYEKSMR